MDCKETNEVIELEELRDRAAQGEMDAQYALAMKYIYADGVEEDNEKAVELLTLSAEQGHVEAAYNLAICYHHGHGTQMDLKTAYQLYLRSALQGHGKGMTLVGDFYAQGQYVPQNDKEAIRWYLDATVSDDPGAVAYAEYQLAGCLADGRGVPQDLEQARELYQTALEHGEKRAKMALEALGGPADFVIRECRLEDAATIQKLNEEEMGYFYSVEDTEKKLQKLLGSDKDRIFTAVAGGCVVGYIHANEYDVLYAPSMKNIMGIAVSKEKRNLGIGKALMQKVENWAKEPGAAGIRLVSGASRSDAQAFYQHCGFESGKQQINFKKFY